MCSVVLGREASKMVKKIPHRNVLVKLNSVMLDLQHYGVMQAHGATHHTRRNP